MSAIYVTSDWHFIHDREFIWGPRGCANVEEMNEAIIENHNKIVGQNDDVYVLGDLVFGRDIQDGLNKIRRLNGHIHVVIGNHDSEKKIQEYLKLKQEGKIVEIEPVIALKHNGFSFWLTHYPTITENYDYEKPLERRVINLCGHSHTKDKFYDFDKGIIYHCEVDAHGLKPIPIEQIEKEITKEFKKLGGRV